MDKKIESLSDIVETLVHANDIYLHFQEKRKGRPPKLNRNHIKHMVRLMRTLVEDIDEDLDKLLPDKLQINDMIRVVELLNGIKRRQILRIQYIKERGIIPEDEIG